MQTNKNTWMNIGHYETICRDVVILLNIHHMTSYETTLGIMKYVATLRNMIPYVDIWFILQITICYIDRTLDLTRNENGTDKPPTIA